MEGNGSLAVHESHRNGTTCPDIQLALRELQEENRSLRIKIAGVETISSLLRGTRDELDTVIGEKESLEVELARLQCRCSILQKDLELATKETVRSNTGPTKQLFESLLKENQKLKDEIKYLKNLPSESIFGTESMPELVAFKEELEMEIRNLQKAMRSQDEGGTISQISRLLGQVTKLEYQLEAKEEECNSLKTEVNTLSKLQNENHQTKVSTQISKQGGEDKMEHKTENFSSQFSGFLDEKETQTEDSFNGNTSIENNNGEKEEKKMSPRSSQDLGVQVRKTSSLRRKGYKRASGEWFHLKREHSDLFEDEWNIDKINASEQLKVTQDLLVQANEIIMIMTKENDKLLQVNAMLLHDLTQAEKTNEGSKEKMMERLKFLFAESNYEGNLVEIKTIQDILAISAINDIDSETGTGFEKDFLELTMNPSSETKDTINNNDKTICCADNLENVVILKEAIDQNNEEAFDFDISSVGSSSKIRFFENTACLNMNADDTNSVEKTSIVEKEETGKNNVKARDSGVDIYTSDERPSSGFVPAKLDGMVQITSSELSDKHQNLRLELQAKDGKLREAEQKISKLEAALKAKEDKTIKVAGETTMAETLGKRLCKSIGHIPNSIKSATSQRIVFESDV